MSVEEIKVAITQLSSPDLSSLAVWLKEYQADLWEQQDALAGIARSEADFAAGRSLSLEELMASLDATRQAWLDAGGRP